MARESATLGLLLVLLMAMNTGEGTKEGHTNLFIVISGSSSFGRDPSRGIRNVSQVREQSAKEREEQRG